MKPNKNSCPTCGEKKAITVKNGMRFCKKCGADWLVKLKKFLTFTPVIFFLLTSTAFAQLCPAYTDEQIAQAIYKAEGGEKTKFPYGIRSVKCSGETECRKVCLNSIRNARKRWIRSGKKEDFIVFMGRRYSPPKQNPNWVSNVRFFLEN